MPLLTLALAQSLLFGALARWPVSSGGPSLCHTGSHTLQAPGLAPGFQPHPASIASAHPFPLCFQISGEPLTKAPLESQPSPAAPITRAVSQLPGPARQGQEVDTVGTRVSSLPSCRCIWDG